MRLEALRGEWALVTGASSGIGREFCAHLAAAGLNLVLVARRRDRLAAVAAAAREAHGVDSLVVEQDLSAPTAAADIHAATSARGVRVRLLVNNAAFGHWGRFESTPAETYRRMVAVDVTALVELCHAFLPQLAAAPPSAVINVASPAAYQPVPYMAGYAAAKSFVLSFSQALHGEWGPRGVLVQTLVPGPTETEFDAVAGAYASALKGRGAAEDVVRASLGGLERGDPVVVAAKGVFKQRFFAGLFPPRLVIREVAKMFRPPEDGR